MKNKTLASSGSKEGVLKLISDYFMGSKVSLVEWSYHTYQVLNWKGETLQAYSVTTKVSKKWLGEKFIFQVEV